MTQPPRQRLSRHIRRGPARRRSRLLLALKGLLADYEAIPEDAQIPDEINNPEHWNAVRSLIAEIEGDGSADETT